MLLGSAALIGAGITAFYMTRMMIMTFFGEPRWKELKSADGRDYHPHESPLVMTVPMIILAIGSVGAGAFLAIGDRLANWLAPSVGPYEHPEPPVPADRDHHRDAGRRRASASSSPTGSSAAGRSRSAPPSRCRRSWPLARADVGGNAINETLFARPGIWLTRASVYADAKGVDGAVNGLAAGLGGLSGRWRHWQNGFVRSYALSMFAGDPGGHPAARPGEVRMTARLPRRHPSARIIFAGAANVAVWDWSDEVHVHPRIVDPRDLGRRAMSNSLYLDPDRAAGGRGHVLAAMSGAPVKTVKLIALAFSLAELAVAVALWIAYRSAMGTAAQQIDVPFREVFSVDWIPSFGISFTLGVDGISLTMIALIAVLMPIVLGASWEEKLPAGRTIGGYFALLLVLQARDDRRLRRHQRVRLLRHVRGHADPDVLPDRGVRRGAPGLRGDQVLPVLAARRPADAGLRDRAVRRVGQHPAGGGTFDWVTLRSIAGQIPESTQMWIFAGFAIAFAIKAPLVPLHTWLPDAGTEAPVGAGTLLVGVLDKVGTFGFLRICLPLLPAASARSSRWLIILLAVMGIVYGAIVAAGQTDLKRFVTFTSIAHFGFIALGVFAFTTQSIAGAALYMVNHGIATGLLFIVVGMLTARGGSRLIGDYGGVWKVAPILGGIFLVAAARHHRDARHQLVHLRVPGADRHLQPLPGLGDHRDRRHRARRRLHAVDLPTDDDRDRSAASPWSAPTVVDPRAGRRRGRACGRGRAGGRSG